MAAIPGGSNKHVVLPASVDLDPIQRRKPPVNPVVRLRVCHHRRPASVPEVPDPRRLRLIIHLKQPGGGANHRRGRQVTVQFLNTALPRYPVLLVPHPLPRVVKLVPYQEGIPDVFDRGVVVPRNTVGLPDPFVIQKQLPIALDPHEIMHKSGRQSAVSRVLIELDMKRRRPERGTTPANSTNPQVARLFQGTYFVRFPWVTNPGTSSGLAYS